MRLRPLHSLLAAVLAMGLLAGCGDDGGGDEASSGTDVNQLLEDTFSGSKDVESGKFDLALDIKSGGDTGAFTVKVAGPFESQGKGKVPKLDIDASFEGGGQTIEAGVTSTGDRGFVSFAGTDYEVSAPIWKQFTASFEEGAKSGDESLATLGIDPRKWLTNAANAGEAKVGDTDTIKITGGVDVPKLLDDASTGLERLRSIGGAGAEDLPEQLTAEQKQQAVDAIKDVSVEIYTGADDKILRRLVIAMKIDAPAGTAGAAAVAADVKFDLQLLDLNEDQEIEAPSDPKPFEDLTAQLGSLGLGGLGLGGAGGGTDPGAIDESVQEYTDCVQNAAGDNDKVRECADLLAAP